MCSKHVLFLFQTWIFTDDDDLELNKKTSKFKPFNTSCFEF